MINLLEEITGKKPNRKIDFYTLESLKHALSIYHERGIDAVQAACPAYFEHVVEIAQLLRKPRTGRSVAQLAESQNDPADENFGL